MSTVERRDTSLIGLVEASPSSARRIENAIALLRGTVRPEADTLAKIDALLTALGNALDEASGDLGDQIAAEAQARADGDAGVIDTLRAGVRAEANTLAKVDAVLTGLSETLEEETDAREQGDASVTNTLRDGARNEANTLSKLDGLLGLLRDALTAETQARTAGDTQAITTLRDGVRNDGNTLAKIVFLIDALTTVVASKATPADLTLAVTKIIGGSPEQLDTFGEVFARFQAGDTAFTALANTLSQNVATLTDLIAQANTARANGDTQALATIRGGVDPAFDTLSEIAAALTQEIATRAQAVTDLTAAIAAGDTATRNALRGGADPAFDTLNKIAAALGQEINMRAQADADLANAITAGDAASIATLRDGVATTLNTLAKIAAVLALKGDTTLGNGRLPYDFLTIADASAAIIPVGQKVVRIAGAVVPGIGPASYFESAATTDGAGRWKSSGPTARYFEIGNTGGLSLEQLGAGSGDGAADAAAIQRAARLSKVVRVGTKLQPVGITDLSSYMATTFRDDGSGKAELPGLRYKWAIPAQSRDAGMTHAGDLIAGLHCSVSSQAVSTLDIMTGESPQTYQANSLFRANMLATAYERELRLQAGNSKASVGFENMAIGGKTLAGLLSDTLGRPERPPWWPADIPGKRWIDLIADRKPTRVVIGPGINDSNLISISTLRTVIAIMRGWPFPCDILLTTPIVPRANVSPGNPEWNTVAEQEGRHASAGLIRSFARYMGIGLLDMHRQGVRAVHGWDPVESVFTKVGSFTSAGNGFAADQECWDFKFICTIDTAQIPSDSSTPITFRVGSGSDDYITLTRTTGANAYNLTCVAGDSGDNWSYLINAPVTIVPNDGTKVRLCFERYGLMAMLYREGTAAESYGEFLPMIWSGKIIARGGSYVPVVNCSKAGVLLNIDGARPGFDYGAPARCNPSISADDLFGDGTEATLYRGGSGWNHFGSMIDWHVYGPVLRASQLFAGNPFIRHFPFTMTVRGTLGEGLRYVFDNDGLTVRDGNVTSYGFFRTAGGVRLDLINPAPRLYPQGGGIGFAAGGATDSAFFEARATGVLAALNGGISGGGTIAHSADNTWAFGAPALRATQVYAAAGAINTSDAREKLDRDGAELVENKVSPLTDAEVAWACALGDEVGVYRWKASYAEKGKDARLHVGMTVQRAITLAAEHGIADPMAYGFICLDTWEAEEPQDAVTEEVEVTDASGELLLDKDGKPVMRTVMHRPATPGHPAGDRYGFRGEELEMFIRAGERAAARKARSAA